MSKLIEIVDKEEQIKMNKAISRLLTESRNLAKPEKCLICNTEQTSFCNSHSIPQFSLKNIAVNGEVFTPSSVMSVDLFSKSQGVKNTGIFHLICNNCDSTFFKIGIIKIYRKSLQGVYRYDEEKPFKKGFSCCHFGICPPFCPQFSNFFFIQIQIIFPAILITIFSETQR